MKKYEFVQVNWVDATASGGDWETIDVAKEMKLKECQAVGLCLFQDNDKIILAQCKSLQGDSVVNFLTIPMACVKLIRKLRVR